MIPPCPPRNWSQPGDLFPVAKRLRRAYPVFLRTAIFCPLMTSFSLPLFLPVQIHLDIRLPDAGYFGPVGDVAMSLLWNFPSRDAALRLPFSCCLLVPHQLRLEFFFHQSRLGPLFSYPDLRTDEYFCPFLTFKDLDITLRDIRVFSLLPRNFSLLV